jgi:hypothetical protein
MRAIRSRTAVALLALGLLMLLGVAQVEAFSHAHASGSLDECAPCRMVALHGTFDLPSSSAFRPPSAARGLDVAPAVAGAESLARSSASGRAPPSA